MANHRRMTAPEKRAKKQLQALRAETLKAAQALGKSSPNSTKGDEILSNHQHRVSQIIQQGRKPRKPRYVYPSRETCQICGKPIYRPVDYWTESLTLKLLWSCLVLGLFLGISYLWAWWMLFVPVVAWVVSFSFLWSITVPTLMLLVVLLILIPFGGV